MRHNMEDAVLLSVRAANRIAKKVPVAMGVVSIRRVFKRYAFQGYAVVVKGKVLNERAVALLT
jgi:hypothetical protein